MKNKNPFRNCKTFDEVTDIIRKKCEELRGGRFGWWHVKNVWVRDGRLCSSISAPYSHFKLSGYTYGLQMGWWELIHGDRCRDFPRNSKMGRWQGGPFEDYLRGGGSGGSDGKGYYHTFEIELKHVPHIKRLHEQNERRKIGATTARNKEFKYSEADRKAMAYVAELNKKVDAFREKNYSDYREKYPLHSLHTGKARRELMH